MRYQFETVRVCDLNFTLRQFAGDGWRVHTIHPAEGGLIGVLFEKER